jgi:hypothetical protein
MPITGKKTVPQPYLTGFEFVACQLGASEVQVGYFTRRTPRTILKSNQDIGAILAFPYHGTRGAAVGRISIDAVGMWWNEWGKKNSSLAQTPQLDPVAFRELIDPWLKHIDSPEDIPPARQDNV